ncbi:uncharacterized protein LOC124645242 [Helicoverpa zea]|uniref:Uncharacterized protein n=1 Tax=Helicoverpa armigera TaxID=29058 RepID=A0A2W1BTX9_HELAM|nr:uncharacterized protein LOC124645242 [Helicoverpa zea]XP_047040991.1 uncharacterized protein LOC124645242 [Helicoverpa zea]XP_047040992.1 uncharacterized protein LOC124645242 [Helicoverpa zea]XP_047040993.1 uncharacterized protein LOC124645242 [Helicoverpa zea]PZC78518.1 hypothetical protein B5X24_HaOG202084 [Helicoverpa armigera]
MNTTNRGVARRFCYDDETGEIVTYDVNEETGELLLANKSPPLDVRQPVEAPEPEAKYMKFPRGYMSKTKKFQSLKANIIAGSNQISHRLLLIPSVMVFSGLFCVILMMLEIFLHVRCHKKNKSLKDPNLYYRSPFHVVTSTFCGVCRDCDTASKIGQLQDQRRNRYGYIRGLTI